MAAPSTPKPIHRLKRVLLGALLLVGMLWFAFFDSHSLTRRLRWHHEHAWLTAENTALHREIDRLEPRLAEPIPDAVIERIAREEYGMRKPGETVYRVEDGDASE